LIVSCFIFSILTIRSAETFRGAQHRQQTFGLHGWIPSNIKRGQYTLIGGIKLEVGLPFLERETRYQIRIVVRLLKTWLSKWHNKLTDDLLAYIFGGNFLMNLLN
jgi:hypothetical protein